MLTVVGARPQFIKAALVTSALRHEGAEEVVVHTGQHYDFEMSQIFFDELEIPAPKHHLGVGSDSHARQTGAMLAALEPIIVGEEPDLVLVYGDTNSTLAGALCAAKLQRAGCPRRVRPPVVQPTDARRDQPAPHRFAVAMALLPERAGGGESAQGRNREGRRVGR